MKTPKTETLTVTEAAEVLGVGRGAAYQLVREGRLEAFRVGRLVKVHRSALDAFMRAQPR